MGLSSVCQNLDASVQVSFYVQRFGAISRTTCSELSAPTLVQVTVDLSKQVRHEHGVGRGCDLHH